MKPPSELLAAVEQAGSRRGIEELLRASTAILTLPAVTQICRRLQKLEEPRQELRIAILRTYTSELLQPYWQMASLLGGFDLKLHQAPFGVLHEQAGAGLSAFKPDLIFFLLQWEDLDPRFGQNLAGLSAETWEELAESASGRLDSLLGGIPHGAAGMVVLTLLPPMFGPGLGQFDEMAAQSESYGRAVVKQRLGQRLRAAHPGASFTDLDELLLDAGRHQVYDLRLWYSSRFPFSAAGAQAFVARLMTYAMLLKQPRLKVIALDADQTLWGGILGEEGAQGIALGPEYPGCAYVAFQRRLLQFQARGFLLALCTKNNPEEVMAVLKTHPHQVLREEHFAAMKINWQPKVENLKALAAELNLGLDAFVFVDDSPHECFQVREHLPQVQVVQSPAEPVDLPDCLDRVARLEILSLTEEDARRTQLYVQDRQRRQTAGQSADFGQYLRSLEMEMTVALDEPSHLKRIAQLTQKTNQFNLTTRRCTEPEIEQMIASPDWLVADFSLKDIFGDSGIVGVALVSGLTGTTAEVDVFLMSCRVIGRGAETAFLETVLQECAHRGMERVRGRYVPTTRNEIVRSFWAGQGFAEVEGRGYELDLQATRPSKAGPIRVVLQTAQPAQPLLQGA